MKEPTDQVYPNRGSAESRFCPRISTDSVRANGPRMGDPAVHQTSNRSGPQAGAAAARRRAGLPKRLIKD